MARPGFDVVETLKPWDMRAMIWLLAMRLWAWATYLRILDMFIIGKVLSL
jgi:hypothetical protein